MAESFSALLVHSEFASAFCPVSVSLLDGDGVASAEEIRMAMPHDRCFSPLLDGDGFASAEVLRLGAITVHKAQGSQFKRLIVPLVRSRLLDRTMIYTALTRGVDQVVFIDDRDLFDLARSKLPLGTKRNRVAHLIIPA